MNSTVSVKEGCKASVKNLLIKYGNTVNGGAGEEEKNLCEHHTDFIEVFVDAVSRRSFRNIKYHLGSLN